MKSAILISVLLCCTSVSFASKPHVTDPAKIYISEEEFDHLLPTKWRGFPRIVKEKNISWKIAQFIHPDTGMGSSGDDLGWEIIEHGYIHRTKDNINEWYDEQNRINDLTGKFSIILHSTKFEDKEIFLINQSWIKKVETLWGNQTIRTRYPSFRERKEGETPPLILDGFTVCFGGKINGLNASFGEISNPRKGSRQGIMSDLGFLIFRLAKKGKINSEEATNLIQNCLIELNEIYQ